MATACLAQFPWGEMYVGSKLGSRVTRPPGGLRWSPPVLECPPNSPSHAASCGFPLRPTVHEEAVMLVGRAGHGDPVQGASVVFFMVIKATHRRFGEKTLE